MSQSSGWTRVSFTSLDPLIFWVVVRDRRIPTMIDLVDVGVRSTLLLPDRDGFLWTFPVFSTDRGVYVSTVTFLCANVS